MTSRLHYLFTIGTLAVAGTICAQQPLDVFFMNGQSLSTGHQSWPPLSTENVEGTYMLGNQIWNFYGHGDDWSLQPMKATLAMDFQRNGDWGTRNTGAIAECPLVGAINHLKLKYTDATDMLGIAVGVSGASIEELSKECTQRDYYSTFPIMAQYSRANAESKGYKINCPAIFWMQGEFNYIVKGDHCGLNAGEDNTTNKREYKRLMLQLKSNMQQEIIATYRQDKAPVWITYQTGAQYVRDKLGIGMAQLEAANENSDVIMAGAVYPMTDRGGHLDANGYRWFGEMLAKVYHRTQVEGREFTALQPRKITREDGGLTIRVSFVVPEGDLVFDADILPKITNYGFNVYHNGYGGGARQTIKDITIDGKDVVMTFQQPLTGDVIVTYGDNLATIENPVQDKNNLSGHGNLRDSDPYQSVLTYIDLDSKKADGTYVYERRDGETTLRPDFEPLGNDGKPIYGQPYPLYNFAVSFYYKMPKTYNELNILDDNNQPLPLPERQEGDLTTVYVDETNGSDDNTGTEASSAFATLAKAASSIKWNDATIIINGTINLTQPIDLSEQKSITIRGGSDNAVIDGGDISSLTETEGCDVTLSDLTLRHFYNDGTGSVLAMKGGNLIADNITVTDNATSCALNANGTFYLENVDTHMYDCRFTDNVASYAGAVYFQKGKAIVDDCVFSGNQARRLAGQQGEEFAGGGAMIVSGESFDFNRCIFTGNKADDMGGVARVLWCGIQNSHLTFNACAMIANEAASHGGVLNAHNTVDAGYTMNFINCTIADNKSGNCGGVAWFIPGPNNYSVNIYNCTVSRNHTTAGSWHCGAFRFHDPGYKVNIVNSIIENNTGAGDYQYSDIHISKYSENCPLTIRRSIIGKLLFMDEPVSDMLSASHTDTYSLTQHAPYSRAQGTPNKAGLLSLTDGTYFPVSENSLAIGLGDDNLLNDRWGITTDQLGNPRMGNVVGAYDIIGSSDIDDILADTQLLRVTKAGVEINTDQPVTWRLYSVDGILLAQGMENEGHTVIDTSYLSTGTYLVSITADDTSHSLAFRK